MKKNVFIACTILIMFTAVCNAQNIVTQFLGIPVDGYKSEMIDNLKKKGYLHRRVYGEDLLTGEFNGTDVQISLVTNNNKIWRIYVEDENTLDEYQIKLRFNTLCDQFERNTKYYSNNVEYRIPMDEDISYQMLVYDKHYEAVYYQIPPSLKNDIIELSNKIEGLYSDSSENLSIEEHIELFESFITVLSEYDEDRFSKYDRQYLFEMINDAQNEKYDKSLTFFSDLGLFVQSRVVWFSIYERAGGYYIGMFYDNEYNKASGEDL